MKTQDYWFIMISLKKVFNQLFKKTLFWIHKSVIYTTVLIFYEMYTFTHWLIKSDSVKTFIMLQKIYYFK